METLLVGVLALGIFVGVDNLRVSLCLGMLGLPPARQLQLVLAFGLAESLAPLVGLAVGRAAAGVLQVLAEPVGAALLALCGISVMIEARRDQAPQRIQASPRLLLFLPISLSVDNALAGLGLGILGIPVALGALVIGVVSAAMSLAGLRIGSRLHTRWQARASIVGGLALVLMGLLIPFLG